ncbi:MAG: hypothetical protein ACOCW3_00760 [Spirochaetota bacterium]
MRGAHRPRLAVLLLLAVASTAYAGGQGEGRADELDALAREAGIPSGLEPTELIETARELVEEKRYDEAVPYLTIAARRDEELLPAAEEVFEAIREARIAYEAKGREVEARLRELIAGDIPAEEVVPTAFRTLRLIGEMNEIFPFPNPEDAQLIAELESRVLLTIDRRRFQALMDAAHVRLEEDDTIGALDIYVNGLGEYGFEVASVADADTGAQEDAVAEGQERIEALLETDGLAIQIGSFDPDRYELTGERFAAARETIRSQTVGPTAEDEPAFVDIATPAQEQARTMTESFGTGDFDDARAQISDYLPLLDEVTAAYRTVRGASEVVAQQEQINAERAVEDEEYRYNWHIRFVNDIVLGRPVDDGTDERREEGILQAVESVWDTVANGPVDATRQYGASRYADAITSAGAFRWGEVRSPGDDDEVEAHVASLAEGLETVSVSYRTTLEILNVSRSLELSLPPQEPSSPAAAFERFIEELARAELGDLAPPLVEAAARAASAEELGAVAATTAAAYDEATPLASSTTTAPLEAQRGELRDRLDDLYAQNDRWRGVLEALDEADDALGGTAGAASAAEHGPYIEERIAQVRSYELAVVRRVAEIETAEQEDRLEDYRSAVDAAERDLEATDPVSDAPRPRSDSARDRLRPLVGTVAGTRVTSTANGDLRELRVDAEAVAERLRNDEEYVTADEEVQDAIERADAVAAAVGAANAGLLGRARELLEDALGRIAEAEELEERALDRVDEISALIDEAQSLNDEGNAREASLRLDEASDFLSSARDDDASDLFAESLENWHRPQLEARWEEISGEITARLNDARRDIVLTRVDLLVEQAAPLIDPPAGEEPRPDEAIAVLEEAEALWSTVYPLVQNPSITPLLRRARILESQQQQDLTEDIPGFERLSQILNTARSAFDEEDYSTARQALDFFLVEQPLNAEARLLDIRLELATGEGSPEAIVRSYVTRSLDEVTEAEDDGTQVRTRIETAAETLRETTGQRGSVSEEVYAGLLPLRSKLAAILDIAAERATVGESVLADIRSLRDDIDTVLDPPEPPAPPDPCEEANRIVQEQLDRGDWRTLPQETQTEVFEQLVRARSLCREADQVDELIAFIQSVSDFATRTPSAAEQAILNQALRLVQQGDFDAALARMEEYARDASRDPMLIPQWRRLYNDLIRRAGGR